MAEWNYKSFWDESLSQLKKELGDEEYGLWFNKVEYIRAEETTIFASVPSNFFLGVFGPKYLPLITNKIVDFAGKKINVSLEVQKKKGNSPEALLEQALEKEKTAAEGKNSQN